VILLGIDCGIGFIASSIVVMRYSTTFADGSSIFLKNRTALDERGLLLLLLGSLSAFPCIVFFVIDLVGEAVLLTVDLGHFIRHRRAAMPLFKRNVSRT
jgi:hypothetical protein